MKHYEVTIFETSVKKAIVKAEGMLEAQEMVMRGEATIYDFPPLPIHYEVNEVEE